MQCVEKVIKSNVHSKPAEVTEVHSYFPVVPGIEVQVQLKVKIKTDFHERQVLLTFVSLAQ